MTNAQYLNILVFITILLCLSLHPGCQGLRLRKSMKTNMSLADLLFTRLNRFSIAKRNQNKVPPILALPRLPDEDAVNLNLGRIPTFVEAVVNAKTKFLEDSVNAVNPFTKTLHQYSTPENSYNQNAGFGPVIESDPGQFGSSKLVNVPKETTPITTPVHSSKIFLNSNEAFAFEPEGREMKSEKAEAIKFVPWKHNAFPSESVDNNSIANKEWENSENLIDNIVSEESEVDSTQETLFTAPDLESHADENFGTQWIVMENSGEVKHDTNHSEYTEYYDYNDYTTENDEYLGIADRRVDSDEYSETYYDAVDENLDNQNEIYNEEITNVVNEDIYHPDIGYFEKENNFYFTNFTNDIESVINYETDNGFEDLPIGEDMIYDEIIGNAEDYIHIDPENARLGESLKVDVAKAYSDLGYFEQENYISPQTFTNDIQSTNSYDDIKFYDPKNGFENFLIEEETSYNNSDDLVGQISPENEKTEEGSSIDLAYTNKNKTHESYAEYNNINHNSESELDELKDQLINLENMMLKTKEKMKDLYSYKNEYAKETSLKRHIADYNEYNDEKNEIATLEETTLPNELNSDSVTDINVITSTTSDDTHTTEQSTTREVPTTTMDSVTPSEESHTISSGKSMEISFGDNTISSEILNSDKSDIDTTYIIDVDTQPTVTTANQEEEETTTTSDEKDEDENIPTIPSSLKVMNFVTLDTIMDINANKALNNLDDSQTDEVHEMPEQLAMTASEEENMITTDDLLEKTEDMFYLPAGHGLLFGFKLNELEKLRRTKLDIFHNSEIYHNV